MRLIVIIGLVGGLGAAVVVAQAVNVFQPAAPSPAPSVRPGAGTHSPTVSNAREIPHAEAMRADKSIQVNGLRQLPGSSHLARARQSHPSGTARRREITPAAQGGGTLSDPATALLEVSDYPLFPGATWYYRISDTIDTGERGVAEARGSLTIKTLAVHRHGTLIVAAQETRRVVNAETDTCVSWQIIDSGGGPGGELAAGRPAQTRLQSVSETNRLRQILDGGASTLREGEADLVFPLQTGSLWGDERLLARGDGLYVNRVEAPQELELPAGRLRAWPIVFATLPERMTTWFSPGVGIVRYEYAHNGSLSRESYELLEFRRGAVDTLALIRQLDDVVERLTDYPDFWPIRASLAEDAELRALLGPLNVMASGELPDGTRRHLLEGDGTTLTFAQLPEGRTIEGGREAGAPLERARVTLVEWRNRAGLIHAFSAVDPRATHSAPRGS